MKRKLIVAGVGGGLAAIAIGVGLTGQLEAAVGVGATAGTGIVVFGSILLTEYLTDSLLM